MIQVNPVGTAHGLRILCISDFEEAALTQAVNQRLLPPIDLIISCGDMAPEYLAFLRDRIDAPLYYVKGNHDIRYSPSNPMGCENIHGRVVREGGLNILGLEGSMWYNGGRNQYTEGEMKRTIFWMGWQLWRKKPIHMIATHAPPRHIHDKEDLCHRGFESYRPLIEKHQPDYFIHGHVHDHFDNFDQRVTLIDHGRGKQTRVINTCGYLILEV